MVSIAISLFVIVGVAHHRPAGILSPQNGEKRKAGALAIPLFQSFTGRG
jgi:hypothetical protein